MRNSRTSRFTTSLLLFFLLFFTFSYGQSDTERQLVPLEEIIKGMEKKFDIRFSYLERDIVTIQISPPAASLTLQQSLKEISDSTDLEFKRINERYFAVNKKASYKLCGFLLDRSTNAPISNAAVLVGDKVKTFTGPSGKFKLRVLHPDTMVTITHLGYRPVSIKPSFPNQTGRETIYMHTMAEYLQETVVVNYLTSGITKTADGSVKIDAKRFGVLPGLLETDVLQTLEALPGVESVNETISNINIRGGTSDQNLVLLDGIKMYLTGHFFGLISAFNSHLTQKAVLVKNGTNPSLNDGVSGTIDIRSHDEITGDFNAGAGVTLVNADAYFRIPVTKKLELHFSGRRSLNDIFSTPAYNSYFDRTFQDTNILLSDAENNNHSRTADFNFYDFNVKVLYDHSEQHQFRFSSLYINNNLESVGFTGSELNEEKRKSSLSQKNLALGGTWKASWNNDFKTEMLTYLTRYQLEATNLELNPKQRLAQQNEVLETGFRVNGTKKINESLQWTNGYHFFEVGVLNVENLNNPFFSSRIKNVIRNHSTFSEIKYERDRFFLMTGLRFNYLDKFDKFLLEPRLSTNYNLNPKMNFKVQGEFKSQVTSQSIDLQEDFLGVENRRWILADNENFPVIQSRQISTGVDLRSKGWYIDLELYYKKVKGISTSNQGFQDQNEFRRVPGEYAARGIELLINKKYRDFHAYFSYTLADSDYFFEELEPQEFPNKFDIPHSASLAVNYNHEDFKFSIGGKWRTGRPFTTPVESDPTYREGNRVLVNYAKPNASRLPYFFRLDASSSYSFDLINEVRAHISLGLINILNRQNIINSYFRVDEENVERAVRIDNNSLRFTPNAVIRIDL